MENPMWFAEEKLECRVHELARYRYRDVQSISQWKLTIDEAAEIGARPPQKPARNSIRVGDRWRGTDRYVWLTQNIYVPAEWAGRRTLLRLDLGHTNAGNTGGFEALLFLDGRPYQGVDSNHTEVFLPNHAPGRTLRIDVRLWSGLPGGGLPREQEHELKHAELMWLDETTDDLYFTALAALQTIQILDDQTADRVKLLNALDQAFRVIDWSKPGSSFFYESVAEARQSFRSYLDTLPPKRDVTTVAIGHSHIDVAWLWQLRHTREKTARSFSTALRLMELYPEFIFLQTQPQLYEYIQHDYPEIYAAIKQRVSEGRWEAGGAMWLEADCNIPSGESLVRQILFGTRFLKREFGIECRYLWLPDVFGYSWALPQILKKSGIDTFITTKLSWNQYNRMPHDTFWWRGLDGSEVLAHFLTTPLPNVPDTWFVTYNGVLTAATVHGTWKAYQDKRINQQLLIAYGHGDGGGGVTREMLEMRRRLNKMPGIPRVVTGRADDYFRDLHKTVRQAPEYVHTWDGELYLEYHRGTYTSQAYNKKMNRRLELAVREAELLNVLTILPDLAMGTSSEALVGAARERQKRLNGSWKIILRNQFHDIIPGSSIHAVYDDSRREYAEASAIIEEVSSDAVSTLTSSYEWGHWTVWNSANWKRSGIIRVPVADVPTGICWTDREGRPLLAQQVRDEWWIAVQDVPACGWTTVHAVTQDAHTDDVTDRARQGEMPFTVMSHGITSPFYDLIWDDHGHWIRLYDRIAKREVLKPGFRGNVLQIFEDKPLAWDAWDIDIFYQEKMTEVTQLDYVELVSVGPLAAVVRFAWTYQSSRIEQDLILRADSPRIDCVTRVDWQERQCLLKVAFPVQVRAVEATYDIQFGNVRRPTHWNTSWDWARFESVAHQWADLSEATYGVAIANDCKYGYDIKDQVMRLSLLKASIYPDSEADRGEHEFTYAVIPHQGDWRVAGIPHLAWDLNNPLHATPGLLCRDVGSLIRTTDEHVLVDAVKMAEDEDRIVIRIHDFAGGSRRIHWESDFSIRSWQPCDLMERPIGDMQTGPFEIELGAYEIQTFLIEFGG